MKARTTYFISNDSRIRPSTRCRIRRLCNLFLSFVYSRQRFHVLMAGGIRNSQSGLVAPLTVSGAAWRRYKLVIWLSGNTRASKLDKQPQRAPGWQAPHFGRHLDIHDPECRLARQRFPEWAKKRSDLASGRAVLTADEQQPRVIGTTGSKLEMDRAIQGELIDPSLSAGQTFKTIGDLISVGGRWRPVYMLATYCGRNGHQK
jgi:hypothetical protein